MTKSREFFKWYSYTGEIENSVRTFTLYQDDTTYFTWIPMHEKLICYQDDEIIEVINTQDEDWGKSDIENLFMVSVFLREKYFESVVKFVTPEHPEYKVLDSYMTVVRTMERDILKAEEKILQEAYDNCQVIVR